MKKFFFLALLFLAGMTATANVTIDSVKTTTDSIKVYFSWNFNAPDTSGYVSVQLATNQSFTTGVISPALVYASGDTGDAVYIFTNGITPNTIYWVRGTELVAPNPQWYGAPISATTQQIYFQPQVSVDSVVPTWSSQTIYWKYKTGNDTVHVQIKSAKNVSYTVGLNLLPDMTLPADTGWKYQMSTITDLQDTTQYFNQVTLTNRKGSVSATKIEYTLSRPTNTPYASSDSSSVTYTTATVYGSGWGNGTFGFKVYNSLSDANTDNNGANYIGSGSVSAFTKTVTGLNAHTTKWWRAYVVHNSTTVWGNVKSFTTRTAPQPTIAPAIVATSPTTANGSIFVNTNGLPATVTFEYVNGTSTLSAGVSVNGTLPVSMIGLTPDAVNYYSVSVAIYGDTTTRVLYVQTPAEPHVLDARVLSVDLNTATDKLDVTFRYVSENELATLWIEVTDDISGTPVVKWTTPYMSLSTPNDTWQYVTVPVSRTGGWKNHPGTYYARVKGYNSNNQVETQWTSTTVVSVIQHTNQKEFFRLNSIPIYLDNAINDEVILDMYSTNGQRLFSEKIRESSNTILYFPSGIYIYRITDKNGVFIESGKFPVQ